MGRRRSPGRNIKRKYPRTEILKIRTSKEHKKLIANIRKEFESTIISDADIVEFALEQYGASLFVYIPKNDKSP